MLVKSNGTSLHCRIDGTVDAPWLTLSHALATDLSLWDDLIPFLAPHFRILRYDTRGHGSSDQCAGDLSLDMLGDDVIGMLDALQIEQTHFVGLSLGGMTGMGLAIKHPGRLTSAIVCDARASANDAYRLAWKQRLEEVAKEGIEAIVESSVTRWLTEDSLRNNPDLVERARTMIRRTSLSGYRGAAAALMALDYEHRLPEIRIPVLYLVGQEDQGAPPPLMLAMHRQTPNSRFVGLPHAGHLSVLERPEIFATSVIGFIDALETKSDCGTRVGA